jgi:hypothetical protein
MKKIYCLSACRQCRRDHDKSIFSNNMLEKTLGISGTTRNLMTLKKLADRYS